MDHGFDAATVATAIAAATAAYRHARRPSTVTGQLTWVDVDASAR